MAVRHKESPLRGFGGGAWLGWMTESNWTDPALFAGYSVVKPLAQSLILVVMYLVIAQDSTTPYFGALMAGSAVHLLVGQVLAGVSWCIIEDREFYHTIRYIFLASPTMVGYLLGRSVAKVALSAFSIVVVLVAVRWSLHAPIGVVPAELLLFAGGMVLGVGATALMGVGLAGVLLLTTRAGSFYSDAVAGAMYLLAGAIFPPDVLPRWMQAVSAALPQTYWLETVRRALVQGQQFSAWLSGLGSAELLGWLALTSLAWGVASLLFFAAAERRVRWTGILDQQTEG